MLILGMESSCDETAASVVRDGRDVFSDVIASQFDVHAPFGGVVPELASRAHVVNVVPVMQAALEQARVTLDDIDAVAVTRGPGLVGALLVAIQAAKAISYVREIPLVGVHHLEGHMSAVHLRDRAESSEQPIDEPGPPFPHLALVVSGGHTSLVRVDSHTSFRELGATRDDAAGEAFDKVAKLLGLGYPGGIAVDRLAKEGQVGAVAFPRTMTAKKTGDEFSFSGLKTAALNHVRADGVPEGQALADFCASFQEVVVEVLVRKTRAAALREGVDHVQVCGGVAANSRLRVAMTRAGEEDGFAVHIPPPKRCTDNAAMIAGAGFHRLVEGQRDDLHLNAYANLPLPRAASSAGVAT